MLDSHLRALLNADLPGLFVSDGAAANTMGAGAGPAEVADITYPKLGLVISLIAIPVLTSAWLGLKLHGNLLIAGTPPWIQSSMEPWRALGIARNNAAVCSGGHMRESTACLEPLEPACNRVSSTCAGVRCVVQLLLLGTVLKWLFLQESAWLVLLYIGFMLSVTTLEATNRPSHTYAVRFHSSIGVLLVHVALCDSLLRALNERQDSVPSLCTTRAIIRGWPFRPDVDCMKSLNRATM